MRNVSSHSEPVSVLTLRVEGRDTPDWPVVRILVDGEDLFEQAAPGWGGFDPDDILGPTSPLLAPEELAAGLRCIGAPAAKPAAV